ncbi:hypothetical protein E2C01_026979 [Portunus trituberculatus]|uniref:Uncharacterized protein n=1 Tax=Portunus trituberculatus TaxID=210409 RepID=A0A5B7EMJ9_PORTR|nr:hypothetical protein [Portunus trituberculatus]
MTRKGQTSARKASPISALTRSDTQTFDHTGGRMRSAVHVVVVVLVMAALTTTVLSYPAWISDIASREEDGEVRVVPVVMVALPHRPPYHALPRTDQAHKRNAELLNTLLGSQDLGNMRNAGRR